MLVSAFIGSFKAKLTAQTLQSDGTREGGIVPWRSFGEPPSLRVSRELHLNFEKIQIPRRISANQLLSDPSMQRNHTETSLIGPVSAVSFMDWGKRYDSASARST